MQEPIATFSNQPINPKKNYLPLIIVAIIVALVAGFLFFRQSKKSEENKTTITETVTPSPTTKPEIDKKSVKIQILNGTGTPGQASAAAELIKTAGYSEDNIETDNAEKFDHKTTTIQVKEGFEDIANDIKDALKEKFDEIEVDSTPLEKDSEFDIVVTTGGKIFETPTPTSAPTQTLTPTTSVTSTPTPTPTPTP